MNSKCLYIALTSIAIPLIVIVLSILLSPWFNIVNNALSDLGHALKSNVAPLFNFGLSLSGLLIAIAGIHCIINCSKLLGIITIFLGYSLITIAVFDEVYGQLHFLVSVIFFLTILSYLIAYSILKRSFIPIPLVIMCIVLWISHFLYKLPRGAAIPELISIASIIPFYIKTSFCKSR